MIIIQMYREKWQIHIGDEIWQFDTTSEFEKTLLTLTSIKGKYGKIKKEGEWNHR